MQESARRALITLHHLVPSIPLDDFYNTWMYAIMHGCQNSICGKTRGVSNVFLTF